MPTKDENEDASLNFIGKKLNWITEYYVIDKSFPRIVQELEGNDNLLSPPEPTGDKSKPPHTLKGSTRTGLFVLADEGEPPPTREQCDIFDVDLTTCRQFILDNGERVLYTGGTIHINRAQQDSDFIGKVVNFNPISGAQMTTPRIVRELKGSEKTTVLSKHGPTGTDPTIPYILDGVPTLTLYTRPYISSDALAGAHARRTAAANAEIDRFYTATSKHPDISACREFLLYNGQRVIYVPKTASIADAHMNKSFENLDVHWNPDRNTMGEKEAFVVREVEAGEMSTVVSPNGPSDDVPTAPWILTGTINGGLFTLPPRFQAQPPAASIPAVLPPGPLGHADTGRLFPVVSTTSISAEAEL